MTRAALATLAVAVAAAVTWAAAGPVNTRGPQQDDACLACVCRANGRSGECVTGGKCTHVDTFGPFCISLPYWIDAGKPVLPGDDKDLPGAFQRCVEEPFCAVQTVRGYMNSGPALQDCDNDGAVTCRDLMLTHIFGRYGCVDRPDARVELLMRCLNATSPTTPSSATRAPAPAPAPTAAPVPAPTAAPPRPAPHPARPARPGGAVSALTGGGGGGGGGAGPDAVHFPRGGALHAGAWGGQPLPGPASHAPRAAFNALHGGGAWPSHSDYEDPTGFAPRDTFNALHGAAASANNFDDYEYEEDVPISDVAPTHNFRRPPRAAPHP